LRSPRKQAGESVRSPRYPLASTKGERFPFIASEATAFFLRDAPADPVDTFLAITVGLASIERLCFDYLDLLDSRHMAACIDRRRVTQPVLERSARDDARRELVVPAIAEPAFGWRLASCLQRPLGDAVAAMVRIEYRHERNCSDRFCAAGSSAHG